MSRIVPTRNKIVPQLEVSASDKHLGSFRAGTWKPHVSMMADVCKFQGPIETKERLKTTWTTLGVTSALLLSATYSGIVAPPTGFYTDDEDFNGDPLTGVYTVILHTEVILSLTIVILVCILITQIDMCVTNDHTTEFITTFAWLNEMLTGLFGTSVALMAAALLCVIWKTSAKEISYISIGIWNGHVLLVAVVSVIVALWNRKKVAEYGFKRMAEAQAALERELAAAQEREAQEHAQEHAHQPAQANGNGDSTYTMA